MAIQPFVAGPITLQYGASSTSLGITDGTGTLSIELIRRSIPIATDASGGAEDEYIQQADLALISVTLVEWDWAVVNTLQARLNVPSSTAAIAARGVASSVGLLAYANHPGGTNAKRLIITGTKKSALGGRETWTFPDVIQDPQTPIREVDIGNRRSALNLLLRAVPSGDPATLFTVAALT